MLQSQSSRNLYKTHATRGYAAEEKMRGLVSLPTENRYYSMISSAVTDRECLYQLRKYQVRVKERGVCPTLTANMGLGGHNVPFIMNCQGLRKLTEYECLALQGFPAGFRFPDDVPRAKRYVQAGNAVSVPVARLIAERVRARLLEEAK